jgi:Heavy metal associated domain 2
MRTTVRSRQDIDINTQLEQLSDFIYTWMPRSSSSKESQVEPVGFWKNERLNFLPILAGLIVLNMLGTKSWAAIVFYLMSVGGICQKINCQENNSEQDLSQSTKVTCSVLHAIPGRVRFHVPLIGKDAEYTRELEKLLTAETQVTNVRVNRNAASIVINYKANVTEDCQMRSHFVELIESVSNSVVTTNLTVTPIILACSLEVRQLTLSSDSCCLFKTKSGKPLNGGALAARNHKLHRMGVLV